MIAPPPGSGPRRAYRIDSVTGFMWLLHKVLPSRHFALIAARRVIRHAPEGALLYLQLPNGRIFRVERNVEGRVVGVVPV